MNRLLTPTLSSFEEERENYFVGRLPGLIGMKERAEHIGATFSILTKPGEGTKIIAVAPYQNS